MSRIVYVGRIPFDLAEEQLEDIFSSVGPIESTRLMFDRATGKSKGYAFIQYYNAESAASAIRNLDNYKVGPMHLKVNYSSGNFQAGSNSNGHTSNNGNSYQNDRNDNNSAKTETEANGSSIADIVNTVSTASSQFKKDVLHEIKKLIENDSDEAHTLLSENPQLAYALIQSLFELELIDSQNAISLIEMQNPVAAPNNAAPMPMSMPMQGNLNTLPVQPPMTMPVPPVNSANPMHMSNMPNSTQLSDPNYAQSNLPNGMFNPPMQAPTMGDQKMPNQVTNQKHTTTNSAPNPTQKMNFLKTPEQEAFLRQIMQLTPEQLNAMPAEQRDAAINLRNQIQSGVIQL
ncbi:Rna15 protein [Starmerella bacillaris]|uniref:Rna15 protein n=1 Tax=Starmerella bacillaris TaxID=1247836 RepID=A0AAV5RLU0_STABA|nr:Rna15 protein [Starmerella bacillaris]